MTAPDYREGWKLGHKFSSDNRSHLSVLGVLLTYHPSALSSE